MSGVERNPWISANELRKNNPIFIFMLTVFVSPSVKQFIAGKIIFREGVECLVGGSAESLRQSITLSSRNVERRQGTGRYLPSIIFFSVLGFPGCEIFKRKFWIFDSNIK